MIDVIIPAYNAHKTIQQTLFSIGYQDVVDKINVYIVNDCSDKDYSEEVDFFSKYFKIKELKLSKNSGPGVARQFGIDNSNSEYIVFIDSDDVFYDPYSIKFLYNSINNNGFDIVSTTFLEETQNDLIKHSGDTIWVHGKIFRRSFLDEKNIRFNDSRANEDNGFNQLAILSGAKVHFYESITYIWKYNKESITRKTGHDYNYRGLEGYFYNMDYAIRGAYERNGVPLKIQKHAFSVILTAFYSYGIYSDREDKDCLIEYVKKIYKYYKDNRLSDEDEAKLIKVQYDYLVNDSNRRNVLYSDLTFKEFLERAGEE